MNENDKPSGPANQDDTDSPVNDPSYFGGCTVCGQNDGYLNLGRSNWFYCKRHQQRWCIGDLFSSWRAENNDIWNKNWATLKECQEVVPIYPSK